MYDQERRHLAVEKRWLVVLVSVACFVELLNTAFHVLNPEVGSLPFRVLRSAGWANGVLAASMVVAALLLLPNMVATAFARVPSRTIVKLAVAGAAMGAACWVLMANLVAQHGGLYFYSWTLLGRGIVAMSYAAALGVVLNNERKRVMRAAGGYVSGRG